MTEMMTRSDKQIFFINILHIELIDSTNELINEKSGWKSTKRLESLSGGNARI